MSLPAARTFECVDAHTCGNPVRVVVSGAPNLQGDSLIDKRAHFLAEYDWIRTALMYEPRGHAMMSGSMLYPSRRADCDTGVLFIETSGCLPMCGHGMIGTVTVAVERGLVTPRTPGELHLETPAGRVSVHYREENGKVKAVRLTNIPSFLYATDLEVDCPELGGPLRMDVGYGGNFYAIVEAQDHYHDLDQLSASDILRLSPLLRARLNERYRFVHPEDERICGLRRRPATRCFTARRRSTAPPAGRAPLRAWLNWWRAAICRWAMNSFMRVTSAACSRAGSSPPRGLVNSTPSFPASKAGPGYTETTASRSIRRMTPTGKASW
jgi:proline racemase